MSEERSFSLLPMSNVHVWICRFNGQLTGWSSVAVHVSATLEKDYK